MLLLTEISLQKLVRFDLVHGLLEEHHNYILLAQEDVPQQAIERILRALVLCKCHPFQPFANLLDIFIPEHGGILCEETPAQLLLLLLQRLLDEQFECLLLVD